MEVIFVQGEMSYQYDWPMFTYAVFVSLYRVILDRVISGAHSNIISMDSWRHQHNALVAEHNHDDVIKWKHFPAICAGNSPVTGEFPTLRPVTRSFDVFFHLRLNKRLSKQWWGWWFKALSYPLWRHRNELIENFGLVRTMIEPMTPLHDNCDRLAHFGLRSYWLRHRVLDKNQSPNDAPHGMETIWALVIWGKEGVCTWLLTWYLCYVFVSVVVAGHHETSKKLASDGDRTHGWPLARWFQSPCILGHPSMI